MTTTASTVEFAKYQGLGNDFILVQKLFRCSESWFWMSVYDLTRWLVAEGGS